MRVGCPNCGAETSLDALIQHDAARTALIEALGLSVPLGKLLIQYLGLFRPAKRQLTMDRVASLLAELAPQIHAARISHNGSVYAAPVEVWRTALEQMVAGRDKLSLPLKSHGYLLAIIAGQANSQAARSESQNNRQRAGITPVAQHASHRPFKAAEAGAQSSPETAAAALAQAKSLIKGGKP
ncbi:hypothetical protein SFMTTN_2062 [Sulfuriferula multivorans]|uniref:DUF2752 domain-containing protein n=1 Tax=Sulfuriferula multivorans TaxID=1559896 RepID=A0A401JF40_9PROT|nr:hypothetical protein [Sulfuriferula multivorans]GBL46249.1 hypothetical protein SFMTTN_2062 [Sulfuriferula multivorans]